jgi:hypothetical protein
VDQNRLAKRGVAVARRRGQVMVVVFGRRAGRSPAMSPDRMMSLGLHEMVFALGHPMMMAMAMMMPLRGGGHDRMMMVVMVTFRAR